MLQHDLGDRKIGVYIHVYAPVYIPEMAMLVGMTINEVIVPYEIIILLFSWEKDTMTMLIT